MQQMAALNRVLLDPDLAAALVPFVQGLLEADAGLAALTSARCPPPGCLGIPSPFNCDRR